THLFRFDANGTLVEQRDITVDIPEAAEECYMFIFVSVSSSGDILVSRLFKSTVWIYAPDPAEAKMLRLSTRPVKLELAKDGVRSIGGIGGSYFHASVLQGLLNGYVVDAHSGQALAGASVTSNCGANNITDAYGRFMLLGSAGAYQGQVGMEGYLAQRFNFELVAGGIATVDVQLPAHMPDD
ncbi:MAG: carboxypeptidase regulatory-like domain-containing protein, partial [Deltaproteobacteria bacterium]|nr:carboxypeptidase regulatory-like domain-containing protein [Deltaproteobacteria bacterium]